MEMTGRQVKELDAAVKKLLDGMSFEQRWKKRGKFQQLRAAAKEFDEENQDIFETYKDAKTNRIAEDSRGAAQAAFDELMEAKREVQLPVPGEGEAYSNKHHTRFTKEELKKADAKEDELDVLDKWGLIDYGEDEDEEDRASKSKKRKKKKEPENEEED